MKPTKKVVSMRSAFQELMTATKKGENRNPAGQRKK